MKENRSAYKLVVVLIAIALIVPAIRPEPASTTSDLLCVPSPDLAVTDVDTDIQVQFGRLKGKFVYPNPGQGNEWKLDSLPGIVLTHGYNGSYAEMETVATELARHCFMVLIYSYRGRGLVYHADTRFHAYGEPERKDLIDVTNHLTNTHPISLYVDANRLALIGPSQGGLVSWLGVADNNMRGFYLASVPYNGPPMWAGDRFPQDCMSGNAALAFVPNAVRTPWSPLTPTPTGVLTNTPGVSWDATAYAQFYGALMTHTPDVPAQQTALATLLRGPAM